MKITKPKHIYDTIYGTNFYVSRNVPYSYFYQQVNKYWGNYKEEELLAHGRVIKNDKNTIWIWTKSNDIGILVHECFHAVCYAFNDKGLYLCEDSEEAFTYYLQWLIDRILGKKEKR
jgi:hypothetical protein